MATDEAGDSELVERCLKGDAEAWTAIVRRYRRLVYSVPVRMGLKVEDQDDVFQETFVTLLEKLPTVRDRERIGLWLAVIARRKALDRVSRGAAVRERELPEGLEPPDAAPLAVEELVTLERAAMVRAAFDRLPERCRTLLGGLYQQDPPVPNRELAGQLKVPEGSLGPTRKRCLDKLRKLVLVSNPDAGRLPGEESE